MNHSFAKGQTVRLIADPERQGVVVEHLPTVVGTVRYRVFHSATEIKEYDEPQLELLAVNQPNKIVLDANEFLARLTASRLAHPLTDTLYALHAARIQFIPFQFKPLLRMLRSETPRILIADEVGVGKTIEAGLILKELDARQALENVLIVCPKALVTKWQAEMRRFDEEFHILSAELLRYCLRETHNDGAWPAKYSRAIVHLELFRQAEYLLGTNNRQTKPGLAQLDPQPHFSLVIFDEAHHLRNTETSSHYLAQLLCEASEAAVLLSATPIQIRSDNLFALLNLLRSDIFQDRATFSETIEPNRHLTQAMRHLRSRQPFDSWQQDAAGSLRNAANTFWGQQVFSHDARFIETLDSLERESEFSDEQRVHCLRDLEEVHTLAHVMNRTRRRDIGRFTIREPHTVSVPFTSTQQEFYDALLDFRRVILAHRYSPIVIRLITDMLERQASSCLPALLPTLEQFIQTGLLSVQQLTDDLDDESDVEIPEEIRQQAQHLRLLGQQLPSDDPKWEALSNLAMSSQAESGPGKLLVFSFFLHTLDYLRQKLSAKGLRVGIITGRITEEERQQLRERFRKSRHDESALDILLSSEVGCEGLDYEFCDRMVNYDIPWNPMRLEQRIGRIDRFGQKAEKVFIFNFITPGTVEERIFFRCFDRLDIFRNTVGDCEDVLGEQAVTEQLLQIAQNPNLSPQQADEKMRQVADNALRLLEEQRRLEAEGVNLLGMDQALQGEIEAMQAEGRFVSPADLRVMIAFFVAKPEFGGALEAERNEPEIYRLRLNKEARQALAQRLRSRKKSNRSTQLFRRWLEDTEPFLLLTFDQKTALEQRDLPFVTAVHPLAQLAVDDLKPSDEPIFTHLSLSSDHAPAGIYVFVCDLWETKALRPEIKLLTTIWNVSENQPAQFTAAQLLQLLSQAETLIDSAPQHEAVIEAALTQIDEQAFAARQRAIAELRTRNERLVQQRLSSLDAYHRNRINRLDAEILNTDEQRIRVMKTAQRSRAETDYQMRRTEIEKRRQADILTQRIAAGILEILPHEPHSTTEP